MIEYQRREFIRLLTGASFAPVFLGAPGLAFGHPCNQADMIRAQTLPPRIPERDFPVTEFGAIGDGSTDCTGAIARAVAAAAAAGGGRVRFTPGHFRTGPIHLESRVELHLESEARVAFIPEPQRYLPAVFTRWEGLELMGLSPLIYAFGKTDIAITGEGTLDGSADDNHWWHWKGAWKGKFADSGATQRAARDRLLADAEAGVPPEQRHYAEGAYLRPPFIQPYRCQRVLIEGVTITRSPFWLIHPVLSSSVTVRGVTCRSLGPNSDGCDPESCNNVVIENCIFDTGDDCIAIKSGRNADGRRVGVASENILVANCEMRAGHGGVVMGSEMSGGIRNVFVENCRMSSPNLDRGIRIKTNAMRGGGVENLNVRQVEFGTVGDLLVINFLYEEGENGSFMPLVRGIDIQDVHCASAERVLNLRGFEQAPIRDIRIRGLVVEQARQPSRVEYVEGLQLSDVRVNGRAVREWQELVREPAR